MNARASWRATDVDAMSYFSLVNRARALRSREELDTFRGRVSYLYRGDKGLAGVLEACDSRDRELQSNHLSRVAAPPISIEARR